MVDSSTAVLQYLHTDYSIVVVYTAVYTYSVHCSCTMQCTVYTALHCTVIADNEVFTLARLPQPPPHTSSCNSGSSSSVGVLVVVVLVVVVVAVAGTTSSSM